MNRDRDQLCPLWVSMLIGGVLITVLAAVYPGGERRNRELSEHKASQVSVAYLEAWLSVRPDSHYYLEALAMQYLELGRWQAALAVSNRLADLAQDDAGRQKAFFLRLVATEQMAYAAPQGTPERDFHHKHLASILKETTQLSWTVSAMRALAEKARAAGVDEVMVDYYQRLAAADDTNVAKWQARLGELAFSTQAYEAAAISYFSAYEAANLLEERRHYFLRGLQVLESADRLEQACSEAQRRLGVLANDPPTLRYLVSLARKANRNDLVIEYARSLLSSQSARVDTRVHPGGAVRFVMAGTADVRREGTLDRSTLDGEYQLIYQVFIESNALDDAENVARMALELGLDPEGWSGRLAQAAQWNNRPETALQYWLIHAQAADTEEAWNKVLEQAPALKNDDAFLTAWHGLQTLRTGQAPEASDGLKALVAEYMKARQWESTLRVVERLQATASEDIQQNSMLLEITALEQHAYEFDAGSQQRKALLIRLHDTMNKSMSKQWDIPVMQWLVQKAQDTGATEIAMFYYRRLASADVANAGMWQERIGDLALSQAAYEQAAHAYFEAQSAVETREEKIRLFQSGLGAYVSAGNVERACEEGEKRAGDLLEDPATLRYLINLARQAHRTDLMTRYARELIRITPQSKVTRAYSEMAEYRWPGSRRSLFDFGDQSLRPMYADYRFSDPATRHFAQDKGASSGTVQPQDRAEDLEIAFRAFVESRQLADAQATARQALDLGLDPLIWRPRLAQVSEWRSQPQVALQNWLAYARATGDNQAWVSVHRLATQLNDVAAQLAALQFLSARSPRDMQLLDQVVDAYERLGQASAGMNYLRGRAQGSLRIPMMERYAQLAARSGHDDAAREAYQALLQSGPRPHLYAEGIARIAYAKGDLQTALSTLQDVRERVGTDRSTGSYWRLYRELAALLRDGEQANYAGRQLLATGAASDADLNALTYLYANYPVDGGRIAESQFRQTGSPDALLAAIRLYTLANAWTGTEALLNGLTEEQKSYFSKSAPLLAARADFYARTQRWEPAMADLRAAMTMSDVTDDVRIAYLWMLVEFGSDAEIRAALHQWRDDAQVNSEFWGVLAALEMRLGNAVKAAQYLRNQRLRHADDPLWLIALANAEEASGYTERAWSLRRSALKLLQENARAQAQQNQGGPDQIYQGSDLFMPSGPMQRTFQAAEVGLAHNFYNGDYSKALLLAYLERDAASPERLELARSLLTDTGALPGLEEVVPEAVSADGPTTGDMAREVVLGWALSTEQYDLARVWLAKQYADHLLKPIDSEVALALQAKDKPALKALLADDRKSISVENRIHALQETGQREEAQSLAYAAAEGAPQNDERQQLLVETSMHDRPTAGLDVIHFDSDPLQYLLTSLQGDLKITGRWAIGFELKNRRQRTSDDEVLAWVPSNDREFSFKVVNATPDHKLTLLVGARDALESFLTASLRADLNRQSEFKASVVLAVNHFTDLSQALQVGGVKDLAEVSFQWDPENSRWFMWGSAQASRILDQKRNQIGRGYEFTADVGYRLFTSYPDWSIRLTAARGIYSAKDAQITSFRRILPDGSSLAAGDLIPRNFTQYGVMVGFGVEDENAYWRRWRVFMDAGYVRDSNEGWGPLVNIGLGGSVVGRDHLRLFYQYTAARQGDGRASRQIGLTYRLFF